MQNKNYFFIIISLLIISPSFCGCWGYDGSCQNDCSQGFNSITAYANADPAECNSITFPTFTYYTFDNKELCNPNQDSLQNCVHGINQSTVYLSGGEATDCSSCEGTLNCGALAYVASGCEWQTKLCERYLVWGCNSKANYNCSSMETKADCQFGLHGSVGCSWNLKRRIALGSQISAYSNYQSCTYYDNLCPAPLKISADGTNTCSEPACYNNSYCEDNFGPGFICSNSGGWNAQCIVNASFPFGSAVYKTIDGEKYKFSTRLDFMKNPWLDIFDSQDNLVYYGLRNNEQFTIGNSSYSSIYELPIKTDLGNYYFSLYSSSLSKRLTYSIFPVCGNGVCETCEDETNCLHYPPESCLSCSADCPQSSLSDLANYNSNNKESKSLSFADILTNPDDACKVRTLDSNSLCNPLCLSHTFIDSMGCIFNKYSNALPSSDFSNKTGIYEKTIDFNSKTYDVFFSLDNSSFYGETDSLCSSGCECIEGNCAGADGDKHCCQSGYEWGYTDINNDLCYNGRIKPEYRQDFINYDANGKIKSTLKMQIGALGKLESIGGANANEYICLDNSAVSVGVSNKSSCIQGIDPYCVYGDPDNAYSVIKPEGVGQCREINYITPSVVPELTCTIHTHAWAMSTCEQPWNGWIPGCQGDIFGNIPFNHYFCATDNAFECSSYYSLRGTKSDSEVVLKSITYEEFCKTPELVCGGNKQMTNEQTGGTLLFTNCPQDGYSGPSATVFGPIEMPVGYYCSLFGNDYDFIFGTDSGNAYDGETINQGTISYPVSKYSQSYSLSSYDSSSLITPNIGSWGFVSADSSTQYIKSSHLPIINRDENEKLYHLLWNYESCKNVFKDEITFTCDSAKKDGLYTPSSLAVNSMTQDSAVPSYPAFHYLGNYNYPKYYISDGRFVDSNYKYVVSKTFCDAFWKGYESVMPAGTIYNLTKNNIPKSKMELDISGEKISIAQNDIEKYISTSCIYWYPDFLDKYYNSSVPADEVGILITPPTFQWSVQAEEFIPFLGIQYSIEPLDIDYWKNTGNCQANGLIKPGSKCSSDYPKTLAYYDVNADTSRSDTCDCKPDPQTGVYPAGCI